ncbi:MAG: hypothetical protein DMG70_27110 [Acidobacteria bacterium]|nr:MAG: hypothetical protein DMG70_27110 [Acidobacteriota bacterium]PYY08464.1 MAG: hypothetical protein DMG69_14615 [Acidobacteriota bacterium]
MLEKQHVISHLLREFPQFRSRWEQDSKKWRRDGGQYLDMLSFVRFVIDDLYEKGLYQQVRAAFELIELFLTDGTAEVRELAALGFLETLQTAASWKPYGSDAFGRFLRPESRDVWDKLDMVSELNLDDCGVLEGEVLIWRVVRQSLGLVAVPGGRVVN